MDDIERHNGDLFPNASERDYAYQDERSLPGCYIRAYPPSRGRVGRERYQMFEFTITKHTDSAMSVTLAAHRHDVVQQRKKKGAADLTDIYQTTLSFGELMNRIFGPGCNVYHDTEVFPEHIVEAMKGAYDE